MIRRCEAIEKKVPECLEEIENNLRIKNNNNEKAIIYELNKIKQEEYSNCSEEIEGIDIRTYLNNISNYQNEGWLVIAVKENKVLAVLSLEGLNEDKTEFSDPQMEFLKSFIKTAKHTKAKLYQYHNHPNRLAAVPSNNDIENPPYKLKKNIGVAKKPDGIPQNDLGTFLSSEGIEFEDIGVVTKLDFCSFEQIGADKIKKIWEENNREDLNTCNRGFIKYGITEDMQNE